MWCSRHDQARISEREVDSWIYEPIRWARKFGGDRFDPWSGQGGVLDYGKLLNAKILRWKELPMTRRNRRSTRASSGSASWPGAKGVGKGADDLALRAALHVRAPVGAAEDRLHGAGRPTAAFLPVARVWRVVAAESLLAEIFEKNAHRIFFERGIPGAGPSRIEPRTVQPNASPEDQKVVLAGVHALG